MTALVDLPRDVLEQILHLPQSARAFSQTCRAAATVTRGLFHTLKYVTKNKYNNRAPDNESLRLCGKYFDSTIHFGAGTLYVKNMFVMASYELAKHLPALSSLLVFAGYHTWHYFKDCELDEIQHFNGIKRLGVIYRPARMVGNIHGMDYYDVKKYPGANTFIIDDDVHFPCAVYTSLRAEDIRGWVLILCDFCIKKLNLYSHAFTYHRNGT